MSARWMLRALIAAAASCQHPVRASFERRFPSAFASPLCGRLQMRQEFAEARCSVLGARPFSLHKRAEAFVLSAERRGGMAGADGRYYVELGVLRTATGAEIRAEYLKLAKQLHPDVSKDPADNARSVAFVCISVYFSVHLSFVRLYVCTCV